MSFIVFIGLDEMEAPITGASLVINSKHSP